MNSLYFIMVKKILLFIVSLNTIVFSTAQTNYKTLDYFFSKSDLFFKMYVDDGLVDYNAVLRNKTQLDSLVNKIESIDLEGVDNNSKKAFLINSYNILVVKNVVENLPLSSPTDVDGFFKGIKHKVAGKKVTLDEIENKLIRPVYKDARVHFVLVCGGKGCPPIIDEAYLPSKLDQQLNRQAKQALNNSTFIKVDASNNKVEISEIFKWYPKDFKTEKTPTFIDFLNQYREEKIPVDFKVGFYPYDWSLNGNGTQANNNDNKQKSNIVAFTPSKLMKQGKWDLKVFNNLYTQTKYVDANGEVFRDLDRLNFFTSTFEFYTGVSKNARVNFGGIFNIRSNNGNNLGPFSVFDFKTEELNGVGISRAGLTNVGFSLKISPFKKVSNFSFQTTFFFPVFDDEATTFYLDRRSYVWDTRFFFDKSFYLDKFQLFAEIDFNVAFGERPQEAGQGENAGERFANNSVGIPASLFLSYFPNDKFTIYVNGQQYQLIPTVENGFFQEFTVAGLGLKYQLTNDLNIEISTSRFLRGTDTGLGETYNLGFRYIL